MTESLSVLRLGEDGVGESFFDQFVIARPLSDFAPPAQPFFVSSVEKASGYVVIRLPVGWVGKPHPSPHRQFLFCLSGTLKVTAGNGDIRMVNSGDAWLMEDTNGAGHQSEVVSGEPFDAVIILLS